MRQTEKIVLTPSPIGQSPFLVKHTYCPEKSLLSKEKTLYIQSSLHADEIPGLLVTHHLLKLLDEVAAKGLIANKIVIVAFANPIGLNQIQLGSHLGRFSLDSGVNFNRDWPDVTAAVIEKLKAAPDLLKLDNSDNYNVHLIRRLVLECLEEESSNAVTYKHKKLDKVLKTELFKMASVADVMLDLHCDYKAVLHMYTHDRLWPQMADLAADLQCHCTLIAPHSGKETL